jgi:hypothetical protein
LAFVAALAPAPRQGRAGRIPHCLTATKPGKRLRPSDDAEVEVPEEIRAFVKRMHCFVELCAFGLCFLVLSDSRGICASISKSGYRL